MSKSDERLTAIRNMVASGQGNNDYVFLLSLLDAQPDGYARGIEEYPTCHGDGKIAIGTMSEEPCTDCLGTGLSPAGIVTDERARRAAERIECFLDYDAVAMATCADGITPEQFVLGIITEEMGIRALAAQPEPSLTADEATLEEARKLKTALLGEMFPAAPVVEEGEQKQTTGE